MRHKYTIKQVQGAVNQSFSKANVLKLLNIIPAGGNYRVIDRFIRKNTIDTSHFTGQGWNRGKKRGVKYPTEDYLSGKRPVTQSHKFKLRLIGDSLQ